MSEINAAAARALCDAATPGPWRVSDRGVGYEVYATTEEWDSYAVFGHVHDDCASKADAELTAAARTLVPALLDEIEQIGWSVLALLDALSTAEARTRELEATVQRVEGIAWDLDGLDAVYEHPKNIADRLRAALRGSDV